MKRILYFATGNSGKFEEVKNYLEAYEPSIELLQYSEDIEEIQSLDQKKVAIDKAKKVWQRLKKPVLVDDSGIYLTKYNNFPGTLTKYVYQGIGFLGIQSLIDNENNGAYFQLQLVYIYGDDAYEIFEGRCDGKIIRPSTVQAKHGLPWDLVFSPTGSTKTYSELYDSEEFYKYSYRIAALKKFLNWFSLAQQGQKKAVENPKNIR
jgi:XTP/dITP diphosphohydrolase